MDVTDRRELARRALDGYPSGPGAPVRATAGAVARLDGAAALVVVEGISDQIAIETAARGRGRDLDAERVVVVPIGGAHAIRPFLAVLGRRGAGAVPLAALCDRREEEVVRRALTDAGVGQLGLFVCVEDLEDELVRAVGVAGVEAVVEAQGDLGSFRSLQNQPAWRGQDPGAQLRRFLGSGSRRKLRYARLLVEAAARADTLPRPLEELLGAV
ncbi:TOPRIM nucleotidyl transferase/hydrolase domain-containing protein [Cellulomonas sp. ICMP 17802]|uniref:TOPRIM nucleotidyl transferase/hydrolase domain-containing protein n=1 Tax=Cellulomonas sp. ICMP 17802 TaxID=3239199 RepID=UPI00351AE901